MSIQERNSLTNTVLDLELQPGLPNGFISVKLPRTDLYCEELLIQRRVAIRKGGMLTICGDYLWELALLLE